MDLQIHKATQSSSFSIFFPSNFALAEENPFQHIAFVKDHGDCDELVMKSKMNYTILFVTHLMSDFFVHEGKHLAEKSTLFGASHGKAVNYVSPNDVAAAVVTILANPSAHRRVAYTLTGAKAIQDEEVAAVFSKVMHRPIKYVDLSNADFAREDQKEGDEPWMVQEWTELEQLKASGIESGFVCKDFEKLCVRQPESMEEYLQDFREMAPVERMPFERSMAAAI